jgi:hypothetical protein
MDERILPISTESSSVPMTAWQRLIAASHDAIIHSRSQCAATKARIEQSRARMARSNRRMDSARRLMTRSPRNGTSSAAGSVSKAPASGSCGAQEAQLCSRGRTGRARLWTSRAFGM